MNRFSRQELRFYCSLATLVMALASNSMANAQVYLEDVRFNQLVAEKGATLENGSGILVGLVEAPFDGAYMPVPSDPANYEDIFVGKTFVNVTGTDNRVSVHSRNSASRFVGTTFSISQGVDTIHVYEANDYLGTGFLMAGTNLEPLDTEIKVSSHSYAGGTNNAAEKIDYLQRLDFVIERDDSIAIVGTNNSGSTPDLLAPSYNAITVGISAGTSARGLTSEYGAPRFKPDIVAPLGSSSTATPLVASAATLLVDAGQGTNAIHTESIRALLFAGATKSGEDESAFNDWDRTTTRPIDEVLGFGELDVYNSYKILEGGEFDGSTTEPTSDIGLMGYDFGDFNGTDALLYNFEISEESELSAALTWNAKIIDNDPDSDFDPSLTVADLNLELFDSSGGFLDTLVDASLSTDYNHEHVFQRRLAAGNYTFRITGDSATEFGFAWRATAVPEPGFAGLAGLSLLALLGRRRRG